jgi:hypothetical protein
MLRAIIPPDDHRDWDLTHRTISSPEGVVKKAKYPEGIKKKENITPLTPQTIPGINITGDPLQHHAQLNACRGHH